MNSPRRRTLLATLGLTAVGASAGCLEARLPNSETVTESTTTRSKRTDDLILVSHLSDDQLLDLRVTRRPAGTTDGDDPGERLLFRRYEVPAAATLELSNLVVAGNTYTVEVRLPGDEWQEFAWGVLDCAEYGTTAKEPQTPEEDPTLNTDAMVEIRDDGIEFLRNECDAIMFSRDRAPPASDHVVRDYLSSTTQA